MAGMWINVMSLCLLFQLCSGDVGNTDSAEAVRRFVLIQVFNCAKAIKILGVYFVPEINSSLTLCSLKRNIQQQQQWKVGECGVCGRAALSEVNVMFFRAMALNTNHKLSDGSE